MRCVLCSSVSVLNNLYQFCSIPENGYFLPFSTENSIKHLYKQSCEKEYNFLSGKALKFYAPSNIS